MIFSAFLLNCVTFSFFTKKAFQHYYCNLRNSLRYHRPWISVFVQRNRPHRGCPLLFNDEADFCDCSHTSTQQVAQGVQDTLLSINTLAVDTPTQKEIDIFIQAIAMNPAIVSLKGYAEVNRELLTSVSNFKEILR